MSEKGLWMPGARLGAFSSLASVIRAAAASLLLLLVVGGVALAPPSTSGSLQREGTLEVLVADDFERGSSQMIYNLISEDGKRTPLQLANPRPDLKSGMRVRVLGTLGDEGILAEDIEILGAPSSQAPGATNTKVIMILIKYLNTTTEPYTVAQAQNVMFAASNSVANYYSESSFGQHTLSGVVTNWLTARFNKPATCDYWSVSTEAEYLAQQAGYNPSSYEKHVYVFPSLPGCGWAGLGGGNSAWINQALGLLVVGHELGHCFGLGHAASLDCRPDAIGGPCTRREYGDPFEIMGNQRGMHFNADHKNDLGYLPAATVVTHSSGSATYLISPIESPGGATYAVKVLGAGRTFWIEHREAIGFDAALAGNTNMLNGAWIHLTWPSDYSCYPCALDMTPSTAGFTDGSLPVGSTFSDGLSGVTISTTGKVGSAIQVNVVLGPGATATPTSSPTRTSTRTPTPTRTPVSTSTPTPIPSPTGTPNLPLTGLAPDNGRASGGTGTAISGSGFVGPAQVQIGGRPATGVVVTNPNRIDAAAPAHPAGTIHGVVVINGDGKFGTLPKAWLADFSDVPSTNGYHNFVEKVVRFGVTAGCGGGNYCPNSNITRAQMAVFLLIAEHGSGYSPPAATGTVFSDVSATSFAAAWIERLAAEGVTAGCGAGRFCPTASVTRAEMAVLLLRTRYGAAYVPPTATGMFTDVSLSSPFVPWIEDLARRGVTAGCGPNIYCPSTPVTRAQMAVFLSITFGL
jgi:gametolysin peptidase M11/S-layer family protein